MPNIKINHRYRNNNQAVHALEKKLVYVEQPQTEQTESTTPAPEREVGFQATNNNLEAGYSELPYVTRQILETRDHFQMIFEGGEDIIVGGAQPLIGIVEWGWNNVKSVGRIPMALYNRPSRIIPELTKATGRAIKEVMWHNPIGFAVRYIEGIEQGGVGVMEIAGGTFGKIKGLLPFIKSRGPRAYDTNIATSVDGYTPATDFNWTNTMPDNDEPLAPEQRAA